MKIEIYDAGVEQPFNDIEIHPVRDYKDPDTGNPVCYVIDDDSEEPDYWSVYVHPCDPEQHGCLQCVADVPNKELAERLENLLRTAIRFFEQEAKTL